MYYHIVAYGWEIGWQLLLQSLAWTLAAILIVVSLITLHVYAEGKLVSKKERKTAESTLISQLMEEAMCEDSITCPECAEVMEVSDTKCTCGWKNLLVTKGLVPGEE